MIGFYIPNVKIIFYKVNLFLVQKGHLLCYLNIMLKLNYIDFSSTFCMNELTPPQNNKYMIGDYKTNQLSYR